MRAMLESARVCCVVCLCAGCCGLLRALCAPPSLPPCHPTPPHPTLPPTGQQIVVFEPSKHPAALGSLPCGAHSDVAEHALANGSSNGGGIGSSADTSMREATPLPEAAAAAAAAAKA